MNAYNFIRKNWFNILIILLLAGNLIWMGQAGRPQVAHSQEQLPSDTIGAIVSYSTNTPELTCQEVFSPYASLRIPVVSFNDQSCHDDSWLWKEYYWDKDGESFSFYVFRLSATTSDGKIYVRITATINGGGGYESIQGGELLGACPEGTAYSFWPWVCQVFAFERGERVVITYVSGTDPKSQYQGPNYHYVRLYEEFPTSTPEPATPAPRPEVVYVYREYDNPVVCFFYNIFSGRGTFVYPGNEMDCP